MKKRKYLNKEEKIATQSTFNSRGSGCFKRIYSKKIISLLIFGLGVLSIVEAQCPPLTGPVFEKNFDMIITGYHAHIARADGDFVTWGEDMAATGNTDATVITPITAANGYNYTGTPLMFAISTNTNGQAFLLTSTGMYAWGSRTEVLGGRLVTADAFGSMALPAGVTSSDVLDIKANSDILFLTTNAGEVWVAGLIATNVSGNASTTANTWHQVETSAGIPLTGVVDLSGNREAVYALKSDGSMVTWGQGVALGGGAAAQTLTYATTMDLTAIPSGVTLSQVGIYMENAANTSGLLALGSDGKIYGIGYSGTRKMLNQGTGFVNDWTTIKDSGGADITNVVFISTTENSEDYAAASIITTVPAANNNLYTWGYNDSGSIGFASVSTIEYPTVPDGFVTGTDNPVYTSVGGHATSYLNAAGNGSICFTGHIINGSGAGLQTVETEFSCFDTSDPNWPAGVTLCSQAACNIIDPGTLTGICTDFADLTFTLNLTGSGLSASYDISGDVTATGNAYYEDITFTITGGADGTNKSITVTDATDGACTQIITISGAASCFVNILAVDDAVGTDLNTAITIDIINNDMGSYIDPTTVSTGGGLLTPSNGTITSVDPVTGVVTYTPNAGFTGVDMFEYVVCDTSMVVVCDTALVTVTVSSTVIKQLYLTDLSQGLDRIDPVATSDATTANTAGLNADPGGSGTIADNFNTNGSYAGSNNTGAFIRDWTTNWIEVDEQGGGASSGRILVTGNELSITARNIGDNVYREMDLSNVTAATLSLNVPTMDLQNGDEVILEVSNNGGSTYTTLETYTSSTSTGNKSYNLVSALGSVTANTRIRFRVSVDDKRKIIAFDNISTAYTIPAAAGTVAFTQGTAMCSNFTIKSAENIVVTAYATITSGTMPGSPNIDAVLEYGAGPTNIITLNSPTYNSGTGLLTWTGTLGSDVTIPTGEAATLDITTNETAVTFQVDYDSDTKPSKIELPTSATYINVDSYAFYDAAYPGGSVITSADIGTTIYMRAVVSDPFGFDDITGMDIDITDFGSTATTVSGTSVATSGCTRTYEYVWNTTPENSGIAAIDFIAKEGTEGVTHTASSTFELISPVAIIGAAKTVSSGPTLVSEGLYSVTYQMKAANLGDYDLYDVQLYDTLAAEYGSYVAAMPVNAGEYTITATPSIDLIEAGSALTVNPSYTGSSSNTSLVNFNTSDVLQMGDSVLISFTIEFRPMAAKTTFSNQITAVGDKTETLTSEGDASDLSDDGILVDEDGDGIPTEDLNNVEDNSSENDPTEFIIDYVPTAYPDAAMTDVNTLINIAVILNDTFGINGPILDSISITQQPNNGTAVIDDGGTPTDPTDDTIDYTPNTGYVGMDTLIYEICDLDNDCDTALVVITIESGCPTIDSLIADRIVCSGTLVDTLAVTTTVANPDSIAFVYFTTQQIGDAMYSGGTGIDTVQMAVANDTARLTNIAFPDNTSGSLITYYVYALYLPIPADAGCRPFEEMLVTVNSAPTLAIGSNSPQCEGSSLNLTESSGVATTWSWTGPNTFSSSLQNPIIATTTTAATGRYYLTITDVNGCSSIDSVDVVINRCEIGLAKNAQDVTDNGDNTWTITYQLVVENLGDETLSNITLTDEISNSAGAFIGMNPIQHTAISGTLLTANGSWDGAAATNILAGGQSLVAGAKDTLLISVQVTPGATTSVDNQAITTGMTPNSTIISDLSDNGLVPDTDGDMIANESIAGGGDSNENDPTPTAFNCQVTRGARISINQN